MGAPSKIDRLPPEIRDTIGALRERGYTIDEIMAELAALPIDPADLPSRSGVGRHIKGLDGAAERIRRSRVVSETLIRALGDAPESRTARLNIEMLHAAIMDLLMAVEAGETPDPEVVLALSKSVSLLASARRNDAAVTVAVRKEIEAEHRAKLDKLEKEAAKTGPARRGFDPDTLRRVREEIYGLAV